MSSITWRCQKNNNMNRAYVTAIAYHLPAQVLDNEEINRVHPEWSADKISAKTGILERHIAAPGEFSSDLAVEAAEALFRDFHIDRAVVDYVLLCTQSPDYFLPTTSCLIQDRLGLGKGIGALDFNLGCSGFVYGLGLAKGLIATGQAKNVLLITAETYSKFIHKDDKSNKTLFGDAAAAALVSSERREGWGGEILDFCYGTDGSGYGHLVVKNGGMRNRYGTGIDVLHEETGAFVRNDDYLYMDGKEIFNFTAFQVPALVRDTLEKNRFDAEAIDLFVFHQANEYMLQTIRKRCGIPEERFFVHLRTCGNTVSSTIPIALTHALEKKAFGEGNKVLIAGFGVGLSMGATILQF